MRFESWTIEDLIARCTDFDEMTLEMDREEFAALRRKITELKQAGNSPAQSYCSPAQNSVAPEQSPIDHGYRPDCECTGCKATARICAELAGWIPVSERMPETGVKVLCFPVKDEPIHATFNGQLWLQDISWSGSDEPIDNVIPVSVTHWMPLPAAPQEVQGE